MFPNDEGEEVILHDFAGNLTKFDDWLFEWTNGRQLKKIVSERTGETVVEFTYDDEGFLTQRKTYDGTTYYTYIDGKLTTQYTEGGKYNLPTEQMQFIYNQNDEITAFYYNTQLFYYVKNAMGDVIGLVNEDGKLVCSYEYDAWGNLLSTDHHNASGQEYKAGNSNPIRYRGYHYDTETQFYYLQSRFYYSGLARFLNSDIPEIAQQSKEDPDGMNLFAYCNNDPVNYVDPDGFKPKKKKKKKIDITYKLTMSMLTNSNDFYEYSKKKIDSALSSGVIKNDFSKLNSAMKNILKYFYNHSKTKGSWDLKNVWKLDKNAKYIYDDKTFQYDDVGNFHFGFVGYQLFPLKVLQAGGGVYQVISGTSHFKYATTLFDDPRDSKKIKEGYNLAKDSQVSTVTQYLKKKLKSYPKYVWKMMTL